MDWFVVILSVLGAPSASRAGEEGVKRLLAGDAWDSACVSVGEGVGVLVLS